MVVAWSPELERVGDLLREVARAEVLPRYQALRADDVREKGPGDFVTAADLASEQALTRHLPALLPGSVVLGEEAAAADPTLFRLLDGDAPVWVIDPIDGTINFAHGRPGFAVIVALVQAGAVQAGWIHDPLGDVTASARRGGGAWSAGKRLGLASDVALAAMTGAAYGRVGSDERSADRLAASGRVGAVVNHMSSGIEYLALALGGAQFFVASRSLPWDHAAGVLIAEEAGATAGFFDGRPYDPRVPDAALIVATNRAAWTGIQAILGGAFGPPQVDNAGADD
jgi:fructose-1,6-bisphosphatase/inositol monophosphatase family enzyme